MNKQHQRFNAQELCSRKLWEIVSHTEDSYSHDEELHAALEELQARRHYLTELEHIGFSGN